MSVRSIKRGPKNLSGKQKLAQDMKMTCSDKVTSVCIFDLVKQVLVDAVSPLALLAFDSLLNETAASLNSAVVSSTKQQPSIL